MAATSGKAAVTSFDVASRARIAARAADDKKGEDVLVLDVYRIRLFWGGLDLADRC